jgi:uncharacterized repeat protein (TIGR03803 family)
MKRIVIAFSKLNRANRVCAVVALCATTAIALPAQTFTTLFNFNGAPGAQPRGALMQAADGDLYGTTYNRGTVYRITPNGTLTTIHLFCSQPNCVDGAYPAAGLVQGTNGDFYGTTMFGGSQSTSANASGYGTIFKITPSGMFTTLYSFCSHAECTDGFYPAAKLVQAADGNLYGTTADGFSADGLYRGGGTIFKITPSGTLTTLYKFCPQTYPTNCPDGAHPSELAPAGDGDLYGTTSETVFKITPAGALTTLYRFCSLANCADGNGSAAGLFQAANGAFYGTTPGGGANDSPYTGGAGTVFKITPDGTLTTLYSFCSQISPTGYCADGAFPATGLVQGTDGNFYGTTQAAGVNGDGTLFKISPDGALTMLYSFCSLPNCNGGELNSTGLVQDTNGGFYGTTWQSYGNDQSYGTVFRLSEGLRPFVKVWPPFGTVGAAVEILGTDLSGATSVSFNGTAAVFTVVSGSHISATVSAGASTGSVQVVTPSGTVSSNAPFRVSP